MLRMSCEFREQFPKFKKLRDAGIVILGISRDTIEAFGDEASCGRRKVYSRPFCGPSVSSN
jgi:hypothetical protein